MGKTISFVKGKGSIAHNNRDFKADNVDKDRMDWNITYTNQPIKEAYDICFGEALKEYNAKQKRSDRKKDDYMTEIRNSRNGEKIFYENVVQIGKKSDTGVLDENGNVSDEAKKAIEVLDEYARTFQERNPNLYVFNSVLHMDEATPHLHIDYIPIAHGYKKGMTTRNSLTKAFQEMGIAQAVSKKDNETVHWQIRERAFLEELCHKRGIEIETIGIDRDNYTIPEFKAAMRAVEDKEAEIEILQSQITETENLINDMNHDLEGNKEKIVEQEECLVNLKEDIDKAQKQLQRYQECNTMVEASTKELQKEVKRIKEKVEPVKNLLGNDTDMVKMPKDIWKRVFGSFQLVKKVEAVTAFYEEILRKKEIVISKLKNDISTAEKYQRVFEEYLKYEHKLDDFNDFKVNRTKRKIEYLEKEQSNQILTKPNKRKKDLDR